MAFTAQQPILADDPLAYFSALAVPAARATKPGKTTVAEQALAQMFGYFSLC